MPENPTPSEPVTLRIETTRRSPLHRLLRRPADVPGAGRAKLIQLWIAAVLLTWVPMLVTAALGPQHLWHAVPPEKLAFLEDYDTAFMFLVSLPIILGLLVTDDGVLNHALETVQRHGVLTVEESDVDSLPRRWEDVFLKVNQLAYPAGALLGALIAWISWRVYKEASVGFWIANAGTLRAAGWVWVWSLFLFWSTLAVYVARVVTVTLLLRDVVHRARIHMLPAHPDRCGGLRPVGELGLRNQLLLTFAGINVLLMITVTVSFLGRPGDVVRLSVAAAIAYVTLGPLVFLGPLLPFRAGMLERKSELMEDIARRLRFELDRIRSKLPPQRGAQEPITAADEELIDRLRKVGALVEEMPVWPFDSGTLRRFLLAYVTPILAAAGSPLIEMAVKSLGARWGLG